ILHGELRHGGAAVPLHELGDARLIGRATGRQAAHAGHAAHLAPSSPARSFGSRSVRRAAEGERTDDAVPLRHAPAAAAGTAGSEGDAEPAVCAVLMLLISAASW